MSNRWGLVLGALIFPLTGNALVIENPNSTGGLAVQFYETVGQSFTAEFTDLTSIAFYYDTINSGAANDPFKMFLYEGPGFGGTLLKSVAFSLPYSGSGSSTYGYFDADFSDIDLTLGSVYTAGVLVDGSSFLWSVKFDTSNSYAGGQYYSNSANVLGNCRDQSSCDLQFRVIGEAGEVTEAPTPATIPLLSLALAALGYSRRKRRQHIQ